MTEELLDGMMEICGYNARTRDLATLSKLGCDWWHEYTCTPKEASLVKKHYFKVVKKHYPHLKKKTIEHQWGWFWLQYGLREVGTEVDRNKYRLYSY